MSTTHPLTRSTNPYHNATDWQSRPSRQDPQFRYLDEGRLVELRDAWDAAEQHRRTVDAQVREHDKRIATRAAEEAKAKQAREDAILDDELKRRYLAGGGSEAEFIINRRKIRADFATAVAIGQAQPINSLDQLKQELRQLRVHRLAAPDTM